jgi:hypothetical protein
MLPASVPVDLTWNAPAECPSRDAVVDEVARVLTAPKRQRVRVSADVDVSHDGQGHWHGALKVATGDAHGERSLDAESCPAIASATAVIIAVAVEGGMPEPALPEAPPPPKSTPHATRAAPQQAPQLIVGAAAVVDGAMLPSFAPGVEGTLGWGYSWSVWRIRGVASGSFFPSKDSAQLRSEAPGAFGSFELFTAAARVCASVIRGPFDLGPCLGAEVDFMTGAAAGAALPSPRTGTWPSTLLSLLASWSFARHLAMVVRGDGFYAPQPPEFVLVSHPSETHVHVHQPAQLGARGALGLEVRFF